MVIHQEHRYKYSKYNFSKLNAILEEMVMVMDKWALFQEYNGLTLKMNQCISSYYQIKKNPQTPYDYLATCGKDLTKSDLHS